MPQPSSEPRPASARAGDAGLPLVVLFDLNVLIDVMQHREPFYAASAAILALAERGHIHGLVAAHSLTTLFYLVRKGSSVVQARAAVTCMLRLVAVAPVGHDTIDQALHLPYDDFEDAVQMIAALQAGADYLVTRDVQGYRPGLVPVVTPAELLTLL